VLNTQADLPYSIMKTISMTLALIFSALLGAQAFTVPPNTLPATSRSGVYRPLSAKYNTMDEILAVLPDDKPVLVNFYDAATENDIKNDIFRAKQLLADRLTLVSIKQQDYPEIAKLWDADKKSPSMILFKDGQPVTRLYEETHYLEIAAKMGRFCTEQ
jgi:hypothetical protein